MKRFLPFVIVALLVTLSAASAPALECSPTGLRMRHYTTCYPWHGGYYHSAWGMPVALVVPPKAELQTHWGWGVGNTRVTTTWHQFRRNYPGPAQYNHAQFQPTPYWPSDTDQFGVYYVRGPW